MIEIEIKKRLLSRAVLDAIETHLARVPNVIHLNTAIQRDVFLDQQSRIRNTLPQYSVFRVRTSSTIANRFSVSPITTKYLATIKSPTVIENGVATTTEDEEALPEQTALSLLTIPTAPMSAYTHVALLQRLVERFGLDLNAGMVAVGEYTTIRGKYRMDPWRDEIHKRLAAEGIISASFGNQIEAPVIEIDETLYKFGSAFEIEIETEFPVIVEKLLMELLDACQVTDQVANSKRSKYTNYIKGSIDDND